jgi:hypothetical protein
VRIEQLVPAEVGWKAVFSEPDGAESVSRILSWAVVGDAPDETRVVGVIVDPADPSRVVPAPGASSPGGGTFSRYRFVAPEPIVVAAPAPPPPAAPEPEDPAEQIAKGLLRRKR